MNKVRQRKLEARARRQESLHSQGVTVERTIVQVPQPKAFETKKTIKLGETMSKEVKKVVPLAKKESINSHGTEAVRRGPGRPPKTASEKISTIGKKQLTGKKTVKGEGKR